MDDWLTTGVVLKLSCSRGDETKIGPAEEDDDLVGADVRGNNADIALCNGAFAGPFGLGCWLCDGLAGNVALCCEGGTGEETIGGVLADISNGEALVTTSGLPRGVCCMLRNPPAPWLGSCAGGESLFGTW